MSFFVGVDCRRDSRLCDLNAECVLNVDTFVCVCNQGYRGDGTSCTRKCVLNVGTFVNVVINIIEEMAHHEHITS